MSRYTIREFGNPRYWARGHMIEARTLVHAKQRAKRLREYRASTVTVEDPRGVVLARLDDDGWVDAPGEMEDNQWKI